jgi:hypothetical protein
MKIPIFLKTPKKATRPAQKITVVGNRRTVGAVLSPYSKNPTMTGRIDIDKWM